MTDYSKLKNAELESLLKERNLPHGGKKAEMVARLVDADKSGNKTSTANATGSSAPAPATKATSGTAGAEDEIDWDDDAAPAVADTIAAGGKGQAANPVAVPNQTPAIDPSKTNELSVSAPENTTEPASTNTATTTEKETTDTPAAPAKPAVDFTSGLAATSLASELEKRKARAKKFGLPEESESEAIKALERAKRFGTGNDTTGEGNVVGALDTALPEKRDRKRGRPADTAGDDAADTGNDPGLKRLRGGPPYPRGQRFRKGYRGGRRGGGVGGGDGDRSESRKENKSNGDSSNWMSQADKAKAEARKAKFATPSA